MIRHEITSHELEQRIEAAYPGWLHRAAMHTAALAAGVPRPEFPNYWSDIKEVYIALQGSKCAYCEKWLEDEKIEHDVEHFRPKGRVSRWTVPKKLQGKGVLVQQPVAGSESGYRLLAYHPLNYATVCKTCNTILKRCLFPIAGNRDSHGTDPCRLHNEQALLIYPISDIDADPEELIEFCGVSPQAKAPGGHLRHRALVTIWIFQLDNWRRRKELNKDRAEFIEKLYWALEQRDDPASSAQRVARAEEAIERLTERRYRHANCLRSFKRLYENDRAEATDVYERVARFLKKMSK